MSIDVRPALGVLSKHSLYMCSFSLLPLYIALNTDHIYVEFMHVVDCLSWYVYIQTGQRKTVE